MNLRACLRFWRRQWTAGFLILMLGIRMESGAADGAAARTADDPAYAASAALQALEALESPPPSTASLPATSVSPVPAPQASAPTLTSETPAPQQVATESAPTSPSESPAAPASAMSGLDDRHRLAIGDRLSLRIVEDEEAPKPLLVTDSGDIEAPYVGRIPAVGRTCRELALNLKAELEKEFYYQATVVVAVDFMARSRGKVYLVGPVRVPGALEIPSDEPLTLSKAILRAGGFLDIADKKNVRITRRGPEGSGDTQITVNVADILEKGRSDGDQVLQPGDLIFVPERLIRF